MCYRNQEDRKSVEDELLGGVNESLRQVVLNKMCEGTGGEIKENEKENLIKAVTHAGDTVFRLSPSHPLNIEQASGQ